MAFVVAVLRIIIGAAFGVACFVLLSPAFAAVFGDLSSPASSFATLAACVLVVAGVAFFSRSLRRAFGWSFLLLSLCTIVLPVSTMLLAGRLVTQQVALADQSTKGATALGSTIGAGMVTGAASIVGLFLGAVFLIIALILLLTGRREVIILDRATGRQVTGLSVHEALAHPGRQRIEPPLE